MPVVYHGSVPDLFKVGRHVVVNGRYRERRLRREAGLARDEVPVEVHAAKKSLTCGSRSARCSPSPACCSSRGRSSASPAPGTTGSTLPGELELRRLDLVEERDRALAALKELEFDHRTGKVSDEDYRALVGPLRRRAAETLRALDPQPREEPRVRAGG